MAEFPALPLWTDAYLADCDHLTDAEHGRYLMLLFCLWRAPRQRIPNDNAWLARKFRRTEEAVIAELRPLIAELCHSTGNWITQKRLSREWKYVAAKQKNRSDGAKRFWQNKKTSCNATPPTPTPTPTPTPIKKESIDLPDWLSKEAWSGYVENRKAQKAEMTPRAEMLAIKTLDRLRAQGHDPAAVLDQSVQNGWKGLFLIKQEHTHGRTKQPTSTDRHLAGIASIVDDIRAGRTGGTQTGA